jgi:preprotein translocase subunit SecD
MKAITILIIILLQFQMCNNEEKLPISKNAQIAFRLAENEMTEGYETREMDGKKIYLNPKTEITQNDIDFVIKSRDEYTKMPIILLEMNTIGTKKFTDLTANNVRKMLAILVNNNLLMAPVIQQEITGGKVQITGNFTQEEIDELFNLLTKK